MRWWELFLGALLASLLLVLAVWFLFFANEAAVVINRLLRPGPGL
jgi:hypothetical protein